MTTNSLNNSCWNDFTVRNGASGGIRKLRVQNENNTADSSACVEAYVQGTTAADPFVRSVIGAAHSYAVGIDTSTNQTWKLSYSADSSATPSSATNIIAARTDGVISCPLQSSVFAYLNATVNNVTGDNTEYQIIFNAEQFDVQGEYNTGTGLFTAKVAGTYLIDVLIYMTNIGAAHTSGALNTYTGAGSIMYKEFGPAGMKSSGNSLSVSGCRIIHLAAGDTVGCKISVAGGTKTISITAASNATYMQIHKIA